MKSSSLSWMARLLVAMLLASTLAWHQGPAASASQTGIHDHFGQKQYPTVFECYDYCSPWSVGIQPFTNFDLEGSWSVNNVGIWLFMDDPSHDISVWYCPCYAGPSVTFNDYYNQSAGTVSPYGPGCEQVTYDPSNTWAANYCNSGYVQPLPYEGLPAGTASTSFTIFGTCYCAQGMLTYSPPDTFSVTPGSFFARSVAVQSTNRSGEVMYGQGRTFPFAQSPTVGTVLATTQYDWGSWDIARQIVLCPTNNSWGYELDGYGGVHPLGSAPPATQYAYWSGWDIARGIVIRPDCRSGYTLDGWGGVHPFTTAGVPLPPTPHISAYWYKWDIARAIDFIGTVNGVDSGYVLDGYGGIHPWGNAPTASNYPYWGWDIARAIVTYDNSASGYVLDGWGGVHAFGTAPPVQSYSGYWANHDIFRGLAMLPYSRTGFYVNGSTGLVQTFST